MDEHPPLDEFLGGGYLLVRPFCPDPDETFFPADLVTPPVLTVSACLADMLPSDCSDCRDWPADEETIQEYEREWGVPGDRVEALRSWEALMTDRGRILPGGVFAHVGVARACAEEFLGACPEVHLLGLGLHRDLLPGYLEAVEHKVAARWEDYVGGAPNGVHTLVQSAQPLESGGRHLGYEALNVLPMEQRHSWYCHGLVREMRVKHHVRIGRYGLIATHADACQVAAVCDDEEVGCETGVWRAWRIVAYDLKG